MLQLHGSESPNYCMKFSIPVIEGVSSSIILAEGLVKMKKTTSKLGGYSYPRPKSYSGIFKPFEFKK